MTHGLMRTSAPGGGGRRDRGYEADVLALDADPLVDLGVVAEPRPYSRCLEVGSARQTGSVMTTVAGEKVSALLRCVLVGKTKPEVPVRGSATLVAARQRSPRRRLTSDWEG